MKKYLIIFIAIIIGGINGFFLSSMGIGLIDILTFIIAVILEGIIFIICHELNHGFTAERNGLKFTVLYLGPLSFKRENEKFKKIKGNSNQLTYLGRAQIDNNEIINEEDVNKAKKAWIKALQAGPLSDLILSIVMILIGGMFKFHILILSTIIIDLCMCIPSYIMGDGKHTRMIKEDEVFRDVILYTYSMAGNTIVSEESKAFLLNKIINDINNNKVNKENLISMALAAQAVYQEGLCHNFKPMPKEMSNIINMVIENKNIFLKKQMEQTYYKSLMNCAIIYEVVVNKDKDRAFELYNEVKNEKHEMPGEELDYYRVQHVLGICNRKLEILNENLMNPIFKGCEGVTSLEREINRIILEN